MLSLQCSWCVNTAPVWRMVTFAPTVSLVAWGIVRMLEVIPLWVPHFRLEALEALLRPAAPCQSCQITDSISPTSWYQFPIAHCRTSQQCSTPCFLSFGGSCVHLGVFGCPNFYIFSPQYLWWGYGLEEELFQATPGEYWYWWIGSFFWHLCISFCMLTPTNHLIPPPTWSMRARNVGCMSKECEKWREHHLSLSCYQLSEKRKTTYSTMMNWLRCTITFSSLCSAVQCIRGACSVIHRPDIGTHVEYVTSLERLRFPSTGNVECQK